MAKLIDITGKALSGEWGTDDENGNGIPVLRTTNFTNEGIVNYDNVVTRTITKKNIDEKYLRPGDIILEKSGGSDKQPVGRVIFFDGPERTYLFNNFTGLLRVKDTSKWWPRYVFYSLYANYRRGGTREYENKTTGLHNLKTDAYVSRYEVVEVSYARQKQICELLDLIVGVIRLRRQELQELDELIKARFVEMFGDPKKNNKNLVSIGSIGHLNSGGTPSRGKPEYFQGNIKWFTAGELNSLYLGEHISEDGLKNSSAKLFKKGTLMIGMYDTAAFKMGILTEDSASNQACANLEPNDNYDVIWLYYVFSILKPLYLNERQGVRQQNLSLTKIKNLQFPAAPFDKQKKFADFVREVDKSKVAVQKSLDETQLLFNSLMQKYFG